MDCQTNSAETTETVSASHQLSKLLGQHLDRRTSRPAAMGRSPRCACCHARDLDLACFGQVGLEAALRWCSALYCRSGQADADMDDCSQPAANPHARCSMCWVTNVEGGKRTGGSAALQQHTQAITAVRGRRARKFSRDRPDRRLRCSEWTALTAYLRKFR